MFPENISNRVKEKGFDFYIKIFLGTGFLSGTLYLSGYLYLQFYFQKFGLFITAGDLPVFEISLVGLPPILFGAILFFILWGIYFLFKLCLGYFHFKIKINKKVLIGAIFIILIFSSYALSWYASQKTLVYNYFVKFSNTLPMVEIVYNTPLLVKTTNEKDEKVQQPKCHIISIESAGDYRSGSSSMIYSDHVFTNSLGDKKYYGIFSLYFISQDSYFLLPPEDFLTGKNVGYIDLKGVNCDGKQLGDITISTETISTFFKVIVLPKDKVESIKYTGFNGISGSFQY